MIKHSNKHYENYQHGIKRAKALVIVQRTIDKFLNGEIDVEGYLSELMGAVGFGGNSQIGHCNIRRIKRSQIP